MNSKSYTVKLIIINVIVFLFAYPLIKFFPGFLNFLALNPSLILKGQNFWTFITSMFMHGGFFHLFANMFSLLFLGTFIEKLIGKKRFLALYLISGLIGGLFFVILGALTGNVNIPAVGASGAIFGLAGMLAVLTPRMPVYIMFIPIAMPMWFGVILIMFGLWGISASANLPIGNTAHLGGLVTGVIYALYLRYKYKAKADRISAYYSGQRFK